MNTYLQTERYNERRAIAMGESAVHDFYHAMGAPDMQEY